MLTEAERQSQMRVCRECGESKPFSAYRIETTISRDGSKSWMYPRPDCRKCQGKRNTATWRERGHLWKETREKWYVRNLELVSFQRARSRAKRDGATEFMSWEEWQDLRSATTCHWCGMGLHQSYTHIDHVRPLCWGGQHNRDNVVMACANCNLKREWERKVKHIPKESV